MERRGMMGGFAPVRAGEELDVRIEAVGEKGDGIAKVKGFVLFVPGVKEGDEVRVKVNKVLRKVGFAEVIGQPSGPIPEDKGPSNKPAKPKKEESEEQPQEEYSEDAQEESEESSEDTEDFGEEQ